MHFIESLFGIAPDAGSGSLELSLIFIVTAVGISVLWLKARAPLGRAFAQAVYTQPH